MVGLVHKVLYGIILKYGNEDMLLKIQQKVGAESMLDYQLNNNYSDEECMRIVAVTCEELGLPMEKAFEVLSKEFVTFAIKRFPVWFEMSKNSKELLCLQPIIHNNFASGIQDKAERQAINDKFKVDEINDNKIVTHYRSPNKLCTMYILVAHGVIEHYGDKAEVYHEKCALKGDDECEIHVEWSHLQGSKEISSEGH